MDARILSALSALLLAGLVACHGGARQGPIVAAPADSASVSRPQGAVGQRQLAFIQFADSVTTEDRAWLAAEGFEIVREFPDAHAFTVRVPNDYAKDPRKANPRVIRFEVRMRRR
ncbi:MAG TPA: hypothetical protein VF212_07455 [Longimicrobiales bacterium]